jgi:hypothetical protein
LSLLRVLIPLKNSDHIVDEGSEEQMKKRMKSLEDQIKKLTGTNTALADTVRSLQKEKADAHRNLDVDNGSGNDSDDSANGDGSPMLFKARKVVPYY